jgi:hypothetical protein
MDKRNSFCQTSQTGAGSEGVTIPAQTSKVTGITAGHGAFRALSGRFPGAFPDGLGIPADIACRRPQLHVHGTHPADHAPGGAALWCLTCENIS